MIKTLTPKQIQKILQKKNKKIIGDMFSYMGKLQRRRFGFDQAEFIVNEETGKMEGITVNYPKGSCSRGTVKKGFPEGGLQFYIKTPKEHDELVLEYELKFHDDFDFVKGGKLPGMYGGWVHSGRRIPDGTNGWSSRYMFRRRGDGEVYFYCLRSVKCGTSLDRGNIKFPQNEWSKLRQHVRLNDVGQENGFVKVWFNGKLVINQQNLVMRTVDTLKIEGLFFSTFFGGHDPTWSATKDEKASFRNFKIIEVKVKQQN